MKRLQTLEILKTIKPELVKQFGITKLALFGSIVRDEATKNSDVDILIAFDD
jgi:predicted nucleotidyltransferase